jgi:surfeit locus 1 family protein
MVALAASVLCFKLGIWQLRRHAERQATYKARAAALAMPIVDLDTIGGEVDVWRRVRVAGQFDETRQMIVVNRPLGGQPGVVVVTPLRTAGGSAVLVERGWVPTTDATAVDLSSMSEPGLLTVIGVVRPASEQPARVGGAQWPALVTGVTPSMVQHRFPYALRPMVVQALPTGDAPAVPRRFEVASPTPGPHFGYAIQWFAFAAIFAVGFAAYAWRHGGPDRTRQQSAPGEPGVENGE